MGSIWLAERKVKWKAQRKCENEFHLGRLYQRSDPGTEGWVDSDRIGKRGEKKGHRTKWLIQKLNHSSNSKTKSSSNYQSSYQFFTV